MNGTGQPGRLAGKAAPQLPARPGAGGPGAPQGQTRMPPRRTWLWFAALILLNFLVARHLVPGPESPVIVPYTLFRAEVGKHNVEAIYSRGETIHGRFVTTVAYTPPDEQGRTRGAAPQDQNKGASAPAKQVTHFITTLPAFVDPGLENVPDRQRGRDQRGTHPDRGAAPGRRSCSASALRSSSSASTSGCSGARSRAGGWAAA